MTIASEIERLQSAKDNIRNAIWGKWITVPSDKTLDQYPPYIDQISESATGIVTWLTTYPKRAINSWQYKPEVWWFVSRNEGDNLYWICVSYFPYGSYDRYWFCAFSKIGTTDINVYPSEAAWTGVYSSATSLSWVYRQGDVVRIFFTTNSTTSSPYACFMWEWNISTNAVSTTFVWGKSSNNPVDWGYDLTWWTQITGSTWVQWITSVKPNSDGALYFTLKLDAVPSNQRRTKLITPTRVISTYYTAYTNLPIVSREYNWTAYGVSNFYYFTGSSWYDEYQWVFACKITPAGWVSGASLSSAMVSMDQETMRSKAPVTRSVWKNADSSEVKIFIFQNANGGSSYPRIHNTFCHSFTRTTSWGVQAGRYNIEWALGDYDPTNYWADLTWFTEVTGSSRVSSVNVSTSWGNTSFYFYIKD